MAKSSTKDSQAVNDAYTGMLSVSLIALTLGCVILFLDFNQYPEQKPPAIQPFKVAPAPEPPPPPMPPPMPPMPPDPDNNPNPNPNPAPPPPPPVNP